MNSKELFKSWNDCIEQEKKHWMRHTSDKQYIKGRILKGFDSFKTSNKLPSPNYDQTCISEVTSGQSFSEGFANFKKLNRLPPLNYNYIFDNYDQSYAGGNNISRHPFRDMLLAILEDISSFTMFADEILIYKNKDKYEHPPIISDKLRELVGIPVQKFKKDLSKQYEEIKNDFKSIQESYVELKNQLDANNKFMIYRLKENNEYLIEKLTNKT
ncbi:2785_t:CDS:2 [Entrophospora sp. SA101]|nr:2785_t:CDS:2 [Entrophospora sp. SA101]